MRALPGLPYSPVACMHVTIFNFIAYSQYYQGSLAYLRLLCLGLGDATTEHKAKKNHNKLSRFVNFRLKMLIQKKETDLAMMLFYHTILYGALLLFVS